MTSFIQFKTDKKLTQVFRVEMFDLVEVPEEQHGVFFAGDCYVILYAYRSMMMKCWGNYFGR